MLTPVEVEVEELMRMWGYPPGASVVVALVLVGLIRPDRQVVHPEPLIPVVEEVALETTQMDMTQDNRMVLMAVPA
jgi:hypothetical protein